MSQPIRKPTSLDLSSLLFLTIVWASAFIAIKVAVPFTGAVWLAVFRTCIGFLVLLPWALAKGFVLPSSLNAWGFMIIISILNVTLPFILISWAELTISAGITSLLLGIGPLLALGLSHFTTADDKFNLPKLIGISLGFTGIALVVGRDALAGIGGDTLTAQFAVLGASACYATSAAMIRKITYIPPTRMAALILGMCSLELLALGLYVGIPDFGQIEPKAWVSLIYLGILPTGIATILRYRLIRTIGASFFSLGMNLIPVFGVIMGALILSEKVVLTTWIALLLIVAGLFTARLTPKTKPE